MTINDSDWIEVNTEFLRHVLWEEQQRGLLKVLIDLAFKVPPGSLACPAPQPFVICPHDFAEEISHEAETYSSAEVWQIFHLLVKHGILTVKRLPDERVEIEFNPQQSIIRFQDDSY